MGLLSRIAMDYLGAIITREIKSHQMAAERYTSLASSSSRSPSGKIFNPLTRLNALWSAACFLLTACSQPHPRIEFTQVPPADKGGPDVMDVIEGRVWGAKPGQRVVVFAHGKVWWAEPRLGRVFTTIQADSTWKTPTHLGTEYAAALVDSGYQPPITSDAPPKEGGLVVALAKTRGVNSSRAIHHTLQFSGYEWTVRAAPSDRGGYSVYDPSNAWTDAGGALHLRLTGEPGKWTCSQVILTRSLGYGTYRLAVRDISDLDPAAILAMYTLSDVGAASANRNPREWDIEISRLGDPSRKNARYVIQPSYLGQNTVWFAAPAGTLTHEVRWQSGSVQMTTARGSGTGAHAVVAQHAFTSGVPVPGDEKFRINLYDFQRGPQRLQRGAEIVIEQFEFLP